MPKISIIIPVYNAEQYLEECLLSISQQTFTDFEIWAINDGSADRSLEILKKYQEKEPRLKVFSQENKGVSAARNLGVEYAKGEYIAFVDADDTISPDFFEKLLRNSIEDLVAFDWIASLDFPHNITLNSEDFQNKIFGLMLQFEDFNTVCLKIFKRSFITQHQIKFPNGMSLGEDAHFVYRFLKNTSTLKVLPFNNEYHYTENEKSATRSIKSDAVFKKMFEEFYFNHQKIYSIPLEYKEIRKLKAKKLICSFVAALSLYLRDNYHLSKKNRINIIKEALEKLQQTNIVQEYFNEFYQNFGRFDRAVLKAIKEKSLFKLKLLYHYSHWRNGIK